MKRKKGDIVKAYVIEKTNQYGSVYYCPFLPDNWTVNIWNADLYKGLQECKNKAAELVDLSIRKNQKYPDLFPLIDDITVRKLEIKFLD